MKPSKHSVREQPFIHRSGTPKNHLFLMHALLMKPSKHIVPEQPFLDRTGTSKNSSISKALLVNETIKIYCSLTTIYALFGNTKDINFF